LLALGGPSLCGLWAILFTNYVQHVDCDAGSPDDHSRNFVSPALNWLVFNAGYHTVHHEHPGVCWTRYPELHRARQARIDPALNPPSIVAYCWATYVRLPWGFASREARWARSPSRS
jgi:fatty acid desaturase